MLAWLKRRIRIRQNYRQLYRIMKHRTAITQSDIDAIYKPWAEQGFILPNSDFLPIDPPQKDEEPHE